MAEKEWQIIIHLEGGWQGFRPSNAEKYIRKKLRLPDFIPVEIKRIERPKGGKED